MLEFVGLRSKLYSYRVLDPNPGDNEVKKRAKGIKGSTLRTITFDDFKKCLIDKDLLEKQQYVIRSKKHSVYTISERKVALSWEDDKRQLLVNSTDTLPWGYEVPSSEVLRLPKRRKL